MVLLFYSNPRFMNRPVVFLFIVFILFSSRSSSQGVLISQPRLEVDGNNLIIYYDLITKSSSEQFYVWVEIAKEDGEKFQNLSFSGDIGANIKSGSNKKIIWAADRDSVYLNENIAVEVKAEKYIKSFNRGSEVIKSALLPGWGQTNISKGKPWWIGGIAVYGTLAGGYIYHRKYLDSYELYKAEEDPGKRADLYDQAQKQSNISSVLIYSAATAWALNLLWVALIPDTYLPLQHVNLSVNSSKDLNYSSLGVSIKLNF